MWKKHECGKIHWKLPVQNICKPSRGLKFNCKTIKKIEKEKWDFHVLENHELEVGSRLKQILHQ